MSPNELIEAHMYLVPLTLKRVVPKVPAQVEKADLIASGNLGLCRAAQRFDPNRAVKFTSFAITHIRGAMLEWLRQDDWATRGMRRRERKGELLPLMPSLETVLGDSEGVKEASPDDRPIREFLVDPGPGPEATAIATIEAEELWEEVKALPERELELVRLYYREEVSLAEFARRIGRSEALAHQLHSQAKERLREREAKGEWHLSFNS